MNLYFFLEVSAIYGAQLLPWILRSLISIDVMGVDWNLIGLVIYLVDLVNGT